MVRTCKVRKMRNAEAGRLISRGSLGVVTGERPEIERLAGSFGGGPLEKGRKVPRWRPILLHEQFLGGWAGAIPPGYPAHAMPFGPTVQTWPRHPCQQWGLKTTGCARVPDRVLTSRTRLGMLCCITYCSDCSFQRKTSCRVKSRRVRVSSVSASLMS